MTDKTFEQKTEILTRAAELLHQHGTPSHRFERVMKRTAQSIGVDADFLYTPTSLFVSFKDENLGAKLLRIDAGPIELGKLADFDEALERLVRQKVSLDETQAELEQIASAPPRHGPWMVAVATSIVCACATTFLGGGWAEVLTALVLGVFVFGLNLLLDWIAPAERSLEFIAAFCCAMGSLLISHFVFPMDDRIATLGSLIVLVPGLSMTISMTEMANRHLSSGVARLAGAGIVFLTLAVGVALAWRLGVGLRPAAVEQTTLPFYVRYIAMLIAPFAFGVLFQARLMDWWRIALVAWFGFMASDMVRSNYGAEWSAFVGAAAVGLSSNVYARFYNRPSLIPQMPGILMLVPGSLGYYSVTAFIDNHGMQGVESAFSTILVAMALAGGLITANVLLSPKRYL